MQTRYYSRYIASASLLSHGVSRYYIPVVHDKPLDPTPAEKLSALGAQALSTAELLAVVFEANGKKGKNALSISSRIMKDYGEKSIMSVADPKQLSDELEIPFSKALQIVACAELGRRFYKKNDASAPVIHTARDVYAYVGDMRDLPKEHLRGIYLNAHYKVIHDEVISIGTIDTNIIHPREVFRPALEYAAAAVVLVHNHPSGTTEASAADIAITKQLVEAGKLIGIELLDHVIVTREGFSTVPVDYQK